MKRASVERPVDDGSVVALKSIRLSDNTTESLADSPSTASNVLAPSSSLGPVRHAEKSRVSTCAFADRVAKLCVEKFAELVRSASQAEELMSPNLQTCIAGVVLSFPDDTLRLVSLGVGTRIVPDRVLRTDPESHRLVLDSHAEVLARRGFVRFLLEDLKLVCGSSAEKGVLFARPAEGAASAATRLPGVRLHFYTSSAPCGNACVRKWAKSPGKEVFNASLPESEWPVADHPPLQIHSPLQSMVLCKIEGGGAPEGEERESPDFPPPGTCGADSPGASSRATCSDKLARWCVLGLEGALAQSLLSRTVSAPQEEEGGWFRPATVVVGRKFCRPHLERALCCRVSKKIRRKIAHPSILCTSEKLQDGAVQVDRGASFGDLAMVWCEGKPLELLAGSRGCLLEGEAPSMVSRSEMFELWSSIVSTAGLHDLSMDTPKGNFAEQYQAAKAHAPESYRSLTEELLTRGLTPWPRRRFRAEDTL